MNTLIRLRSNAYRICKELYQFRNIKAPDTRTILFILGCQRSGTSLMTRILHKDWNAKVYFEDSKLSLQEGEDRLRLKSVPIVRGFIESERFPLIALKPLVESQNALKLLASFPNSNGIWMYRYYKDVAASNLRKFGLRNGIMNLRYIVQDQPQNWRAENVSRAIREIVQTYFSEMMNPYDAAALFWYVRNTFFFDLNLDSHAAVITCHYDKLVNYPQQTMKKIYAFLDQPYPGDHIVKNIQNSSVGKGRQIVLSKEIESLCEELWGRLELSNESIIRPRINQRTRVGLKSSTDIETPNQSSV